LPPKKIRISVKSIASCLTYLKALPEFFLRIFSQPVTISKKWKNPGSAFHIGEGPVEHSCKPPVTRLGYMSMGPIDPSILNNTGLPVNFSFIHMSLVF
jgi:hypothetical protein